MVSTFPGRKGYTRTTTKHQMQRGLSGSQQNLKKDLNWAALLRLRFRNHSSRCPLCPASFLPSQSASGMLKPDQAVSVRTCSVLAYGKTSNYSGPSPYGICLAAGFPRIAIFCGFLNPHSLGKPGSINFFGPKVVTSISKMFALSFSQHLISSK